MADDYESLLKRAQEKLPKGIQETTRFEVPPFESFAEGAKTVISNFTEVARFLGRDPNHLMKFILAAAGSNGELDGPRLKFMGNRSTDFLNNKLDEYVKTFVNCQTCGKPDTSLYVDQKTGENKIKCKACGANYVAVSI